MTEEQRIKKRSIDIENIKNGAVGKSKKTNSVLRHRKNEFIIPLIANMTLKKEEKLTIISEHFNQVRSTSKCDYEHAYKVLLDEVKEQSQIEHMRMEFIQSYISDMKVAYDNYMIYRTGKGDGHRLALTWFHTYLTCKSKLEEFYPSLKEIQEKEVQIVMNFVEAESKHIKTFEQELIEEE